MYITRRREVPYSIQWPLEWSTTGTDVSVRSGTCITVDLAQAWQLPSSIARSQGLRLRWPLEEYGIPPIRVQCTVLYGYESALGNRSEVRVLRRSTCLLKFTPDEEMATSIFQVVVFPSGKGILVRKFSWGFWKRRRHVDLIKALWRYS